MKTSESLRKVYVAQAIKADSTSDKALWKSALFCSRVVGNYDRGATIGLANDMSRSPDTVEDRAHGYMMFEELCKTEEGKFRLFVFHARRLPFIHFSHFRALYDNKIAFGLSEKQTLDLLMDIVQNEGGISSRNLSDFIRKKHGKERDWKYYSGRVLKEIEKTLNSPDTPKDVRKVLIKTRDEILQSQS